MATERNVFVDLDICEYCIDTILYSIFISPTRWQINRSGSVRIGMQPWPRLLSKRWKMWNSWRKRTRLQVRPRVTYLIRRELLNRDVTAFCLEISLIDDPLLACYQVQPSLIYMNWITCQTLIQPNTAIKVTHQVISSPTTCSINS